MGQGSSDFYCFSGWSPHFIYADPQSNVTKAEKNARQVAKRSILTGQEDSTGHIPVYVVPGIHKCEYAEIKEHNDSNNGKNTDSNSSRHPDRR
jgi:hypothetical protein